MRKLPTFDPSHENIRDIKIIKFQGTLCRGLYEQKLKLLYVPYHNFRGLYHEECTNRIGIKGYHMSFG